MNKLKKKVFWVILGILTMFLITILSISNLQSYKHDEDAIKNNLIRMNSERTREENKKVDLLQPNGIIKEDTNPKVFMDYKVYVVLLNERNEVKEIINHSQDSSISDQEIKNIAEEIINNNSNKKTNIGNLYFEKYSYAFKNNDTLTIIDNTDVQERLIAILKNSILIFIMLELVIIYISIKLTNWIIKPVIEAFNKQKQFVADASHELKTPLSVIMANADALEKEPNETKWLNNIKSESERMNNLISDLLDMASIENEGKQQFEEENISKLIERSVLTFESLMYEKNINLQYNIEENIKLNCNSNQIKQLMSILLDNAIKHSSKNGEIRVELKKEKNNIILEVKNKGEEIPKEIQEKIFERFYRGDESRNRNENRYGLGLAIAKNIVENHGGKIGVKSINGENIFKVILK